MKKIGIVGSEGFFGKTLVKISNEFNFKIIKIIRENFVEYKNDRFDILINCAMPSKKYLASKNPLLDFQESVGLTANLVYSWNFDKFIQISSISVNEIKNKHPYGINKKAAEIIASSTKSIIVRLGTIYGEGLNKGALYDLLNSNKLYVDISSEYDFISIDFVSRWIFSNMDREGIVELGAKDTTSLSEIASALGLKIESGDRFEQIFSSKIEKDMPSSKEVLQFAKNYQNLLNK